MSRDRYREPPEFEEYRNRPGIYGEALRLALGEDPDDLDRIIEAENQARPPPPPNVFPSGYRPGRKKKPEPDADQ